MSGNRTHQVSCSITSGPEGSASFAEAERLAVALAALARRRGFGVLHEDIDEDLSGAAVSSVVAHLDHGEAAS